ncbi:serine acetyltransferase [Kineosporia sp. J2-2]|uniref:Serine acetyltransferase n=1 Tax=Kineosporia corallincola TaxID=2835133 RepID=A0ABS5THH6_9ACTN|nr:serine acetyltransferase [Kineosporia corallincola]MBT0770547.1 serine acetyltransferase [Kineosporia corallincola]
MTPTAWLRTCRTDLRANTGYPKSQLVLLLLRTAQALRASRRPWARAAYPPVAVLYKVVSEWVLGIELPPSTPVGPGLRLRHGVGTVVNPHATIGAGVMLRHGVTIGNRRSTHDCPVIEDEVEIGANAIVIGAVRIGARSQIAAGTVVLQDVPPDSVVHTVQQLAVRPRRLPGTPQADTSQA